MILESVRMYGKPKDQYLCSAEVVLSEGSMRFCVRGIRLIDLGKDKPFMAMPAWKKPSLSGNVFEDMFFPMTSPAREFLEDPIMASFLAHARGK